MHIWSKSELVKFYEQLLDDGIIKENGSASKRMTQVKNKIEKNKNIKRLKRIERMRLFKVSNGQK